MLKLFLSPFDYRMSERKEMERERKDGVSEGGDGGQLSVIERLD